MKLKLHSVAELKNGIKIFIKDYGDNKNEFLGQIKFSKQEDGSYIGYGGVSLYNIDELKIDAKKKDELNINEESVPEDEIPQSTPMKEYEAGAEIEKEHKPTAKKIRDFYENVGSLPTDEDIYRWIALDHVNEFPNYYNTSVGLPEMERRLKEDKDIETPKAVEEAVKSFYIDKQYEITQMKDQKQKEKIDSRIQFNIYKQLIDGHLIKKLNPKSSKQEWCLVSKSDNGKVLKWFGTAKPSSKEIAKNEKRINYFKNVAIIKSSQQMEKEEAMKSAMLEFNGLLETFIASNGKEYHINGEVEYGNVFFNVTDPENNCLTNNQLGIKDGFRIEAMYYSDGDYFGDKFINEEIEELKIAIEESIEDGTISASINEVIAVLSEEDFEKRFNNLLKMVSDKVNVKIKDYKDNIYEVLQTMNTLRNKYIKVKNVKTNQETSLGSNELKKGFVILNSEFEASIDAKFIKTSNGWVGRVVSEDDKDYKIKFVDGPKMGKEDTIKKEGIEVIKSSINDVETFDRIKDNEGKEYFILKKDDHEVKLWSIETEQVIDISIPEFDEKYIKAQKKTNIRLLTKKDLEESAKNIKQPLLDPSLPYTQGSLEDLGYELSVNSNDGVTIARGSELTFELYEVGMGVLKTLGMYSTIKADFNKKKQYLERSLSKKYKPEQMQDILNQIKNADPSGDKADYAIWICNILVKDIIKFPEDIDKIKEKLTLFNKVKSRVNIKKDINQYKSYGELSEALEPYKEKEKIPESKGEEERRKIEEGQKEIYDDGTYKIIQVNNPEACSVLFRGTEWCVKDPKWSGQYLKQADLFYFMKNGKPYALFHKPTAQFFNVHDNPLSDKVMKELYPFVKKYLNCIMLEYEDDEIEIV
jgi:hypothetical protein